MISVQQIVAIIIVGIQNNNKSGQKAYSADFKYHINKNI